MQSCVRKSILQVDGSHVVSRGRHQRQLGSFAQLNLLQPACETLVPASSPPLLRSKVQYIFVYHTLDRIIARLQLLTVLLASTARHGAYIYLS